MSGGARKPEHSWIFNAFSCGVRKEDVSLAEIGGAPNDGIRFIPLPKHVNADKNLFPNPITLCSRISAPSDTPRGWRGPEWSPKFASEEETQFRDASPAKSIASTVKNSWTSWFRLSDRSQSLAPIEEPLPPSYAAVKDDTSTDWDPQDARMYVTRGPNNRGWAPIDVPPVNEDDLSVWRNRRPTHTPEPTDIVLERNRRKPPRRDRSTQTKRTECGRYIAPNDVVEGVSGMYGQVLLEDLAAGEESDENDGLKNSNISEARVSLQIPHDPSQLHPAWSPRIQQRRSASTSSPSGVRSPLAYAREARKSPPPQETDIRAQPSLREQIRLDEAMKPIRPRAVKNNGGSILFDLCINASCDECVERPFDTPIPDERTVNQISEDVETKRLEAMRPFTFMGIPNPGAKASSSPSRYRRKADSTMRLSRSEKVLADPLVVGRPIYGGKSYHTHEAVSRQIDEAVGKRYRGEIPTKSQCVTYKGVLESPELHQVYVPTVNRYAPCDPGDHQKNRGKRQSKQSTQKRDSWLSHIWQPNERYPCVRQASSHERQMHTIGK